MHPLDENPTSTQLNTNIDKKHLHGLLLKLGCLYVYKGNIWIKRDMLIWNNCISSDITDYEFILHRPFRGNRKTCLHIKQIPRDASEDLIAVDEHGNNKKVCVHMQQSPLHNTDTTNKILTDEQLQLLESYRTDHQSEQVNGPKH